MNLHFSNYGSVRYDNITLYNIFKRFTICISTKNMPYAILLLLDRIIGFNSDLEYFSSKMITSFQF